MVLPDSPLQRQSATKPPVLAEEEARTATLGLGMLCFSLSPTDVVRPWHLATPLAQVPGKGIAWKLSESMACTDSSN